MTKFLVSFCNLSVPDLALGLYDVDADVFQWLDLTGGGVPVTGGSGICFAHNYCWCIVSPSHERCYLAMLDHNFALRRIYHLQDVRDGHSLLAWDDGFLVNDTARNQITRIELHGDGVREVSVWRADDGLADTMHVNSVACFAGEIVVSVFGEKPTDGWPSAIQGRVVNISTGEILCENLAHPHSLLAVGGTLYWLESRPGLVHRFTRHDGHTVVSQLDGYLRGIAQDGEYLYVAASARWRRSRSSGTVNDPVADTSTGTHSWLYRLHLPTLDHDRKQLTAYGSEIFDLAPVPSGFALRSLPSVDAVTQRIWRAEEALLQTRFDLETAVVDREERIAAREAELAASRDNDALGRRLLAAEDWAANARSQIDAIHLRLDGHDQTLSQSVPPLSEAVAHQVEQIAEFQRNCDGASEDAQASGERDPHAGAGRSGRPVRQIGRDGLPRSMRAPYPTLFALTACLLAILIGVQRWFRKVGRTTAAG